MTTTPVQPGSARWNELRDEGIARDGNRNWFLGDAALEIAPMSDDGVNTGGYELLQQFADEVGVNFSSLHVYRSVAHAWPPITRVTGTSHKVHSMLMGHQHLIRPGMTVTQAHATLGHSTTGRTGPMAQPEDRVEAATRLLDNLTDPHTTQRFVNSLTPEAMESLAEAALRREAAAHGVTVYPRQTVPDPEPEWHRLTRRIGVDLVVVTGLINGLRANGDTGLADRATDELREVLATGITRLEVIPDTIEGLA